MVRYAWLSVVQVDIEARRPGTISLPGSLVSEMDESSPVNLLVGVNDNNDDMVSAIWMDNTDTTIGQSDEDIVKVTLAPPEFNKGTMEMSIVPTSKVRMYTADAKSPGDIRLVNCPVNLTMDSMTCTVDLSDPKGDLSGLATEDGASLFIEGMSPTEDVKLKLAYKNVAGVEGPKDEVHLSVVHVHIENPTDTDEDGNVDDPASAANNWTGNEFTYDSAHPGVLKIPVQVKIEPDSGQLRSILLNRIRIRISPINDSHTGGGNVLLEWDNVFGGEPTSGKGVYKEVSRLWQATVSFTKLPPDNIDYGNKTVTVHLLDPDKHAIHHQDAEIQVFFLKGEDNHPDLPGLHDLGSFSATDVDNYGNGNSRRSPNWFFYWNRTNAGDPNARYSDKRPEDFGYTPAGAQWTTYTGSRERMLVYDRACLRDPSNGRVTTGIDTFRDIVLHEKRHVLQVQEHNALGPWNVALNGARIGWSFFDNEVKIIRSRTNLQNSIYNHFGPGPDGQPGIGGIDDDGDGLVDEIDEFMAGPGDTTVGEDIDLDPDGDLWGDVATDPDNDQTIRDSWIESQADEAEQKCTRCIPCE